MQAHDYLGAAILPGTTATQRSMFIDPASKRLHIEYCQSEENETFQHHAQGRDRWDDGMMRVVHGTESGVVAALQHLGVKSPCCHQCFKMFHKGTERFES